MAQPTDREFFIPTPNRATLFFRTFFPWQLIRFIWINLKMLRMIGLGHHGREPLRPIHALAPAEEHPRPAPH